jgi:hypothetical protein
MDLAWWTEMTVFHVYCLLGSILMEMPSSVGPIHSMQMGWGWLVYGV